MKKKITWLRLSCLITAALVLSSCAKSTPTTATTTSTLTSAPASTQTTAPTSTRTTVPTTTATTTTAGNWWDSIGKPLYGGTLTFRLNKNIVSFDPYNSASLMTIESSWMDRLLADDWTLNPSTFAYQITFRPADYVGGDLAKSWEFTDPRTIVFHLRQGIHWQNTPPVNGREFIADDVVFDFDHLWGVGDGYSKPSPYLAFSPPQYLVSASATDKYTVVLKWNAPNPESILETVQALQPTADIEDPEAVQQWGNLNDWHHAIGTGPFILTDFVDSSSATLVKNPNYWGYDERYPQNQLPYIDKMNVLIIPDDATALAGMRTGKIDVIYQASIQAAQSMKTTNPDVVERGFVKSRVNGDCIQHRQGHLYYFRVRSLH